MSPASTHAAAAPASTDASHDAWLDAVAWNADGLVPAIAQQAGTGDVLMMAWMNRESLALTRQLGRAVYWSRSRGKLWRKGEESGHVQTVHAIRLDCDADVVLLEVTQAGPPPGVACHTGRHSCFYRELTAGAMPAWAEVLPVLTGSGAGGEAAGPPPKAPRVAPSQILPHLTHVIAQRRAAARAGQGEGSYVARLIAKGPDAVLKKVGEEAVEVVMAAKDGDADHLVREVADLWFHSLVALAQAGRGADDVLIELARREGVSGLEEFARRPQLGGVRPEGARPATEEPR